MSAVDFSARAVLSPSLVICSPSSYRPSNHANHPELRLDAAHVSNPALAPRQLQRSWQMHIYFFEFAELQHRSEAHSTEVDIFFFGGFPRRSMSLSARSYIKLSDEAAAFPQRFDGGVPEG